MEPTGKTDHDKSANLFDILANFLENVRRLIILGIGNELRGDDGAGVIFVRELSRENPPENVVLLSCGQSPENFTGVILRESPSHIIIVDCADISAEPGTVSIIFENEISGIALSTHNLPLTLFLKYLRGHLPNVRILIIGIQPGVLDLGAGLSDKVRGAIDGLLKVFKGIFEMLRSSMASSRKTSNTHVA
ncbi:MAG: hydrogenase maturation peptidase HycI [Candidatus Baldrarchaeia archaeon]